jgi:hypothetical protein
MMPWSLESSIILDVSTLQMHLNFIRKVWGILCWPREVIDWNVSREDVPVEDTDVLLWFPCKKKGLAPLALLLKDSSPLTTPLQDLPFEVA